MARAQAGLGGPPGTSAELLLCRLLLPGQAPRAVCAQSPALAVVGPAFPGSWVSGEQALLWEGPSLQLEGSSCLLASE